MNRQIFNKICRVKRRILPNERVILFGSQARGDARPDSDWDLLVLLNKPKKEFSDYDNYGYPFAEIGLDSGTHISTKVFTESEWEKGKIFPFYKNVMREGIEIK
jgi:predicted nucleotidyltransferase